MDRRAHEVQALTTDLLAVNGHGGGESLCFEVVTLDGTVYAPADGFMLRSVALIGLRFSGL